MSSLPRYLGAALLLLWLAPAANAAPDAEGPAPPRQLGLEEGEFDALDRPRRKGRRRLRLRLRLQQDFTPGQEHDGTDVDTYTSELRASLAQPVTKDLALRLVARVDALQFDFRGSRRFLDTGRSSGDPFDELFDTRFRLEARYRLTDEWSLLGAGTLGSSWESGSDYGEGLRGSGAFAVGYSWRKRVSVIAGLRVGSRMAAGGVRLRPLLKLSWRVTDDLELETRNLGLRVTYRIQRGLEMYAASEWRSRSYRLEDRGGEIGKGILGNRTVPAILGVSWKPSKRWRLRAHAGAIAYQRYAVRDDDRRRVDRSTSDGPAFTGRLEAQLRF